LRCVCIDESIDQLGDQVTNTILTTLSAARLKQHYDSCFWTSKTIYMHALENAQKRPDSFALRDRFRRLSFAQVIQAADALAADCMRKWKCAPAKLARSPVGVRA
jgi:non-ribosomal peptide synthetase component E (peptide arylation enzyme)